MADTNPSTAAQSSTNTDTKEHKNPFDLLSRLRNLFPFLRNKNLEEQNLETSVIVEEAEAERAKPNAVSFNGHRRPVVPILEAVAEESSSRTYNPVIIWQVYAIGGFFIVQWALARWKERKSRANKKEEDNQDVEDEDSYL